MIHTATFKKILSHMDIITLEKKFNTTIPLVEEIIKQNFRGISSKFVQRKNTYIFEVQIDFIKLLGKSEMQNEDILFVENKLIELKNFVFGKDIDLILTRIDYRFDITVPQNIRKVLLKLYKKTFEKYKFNKKYDQFETTIYYNSKSTQIAIYDKEEERNTKHQEIMDYEKDVLRFEVRLMNKHLNYLKNKYGISKELANYFDKSIYKKYFSMYALPFLFKGDYYKIYVAEKIINNSNINEKDKRLLREFLVDVSKYGISKTRQLKVPIKNVNKEKDSDLINNDNEEHNNLRVNKYSKHIFNKAMHLLEELNINPILIPKNEKVSSSIKNPLSSLF